MKTFSESKKMKGACVVTGTTVLILGGLIAGSMQGADAITADVLQIAVLTFGGAFAAAWSAAIGMQGWHDVKHGSLPPAMALEAPPEVVADEPEVSAG